MSPFTTKASRMFLTFLYCFIKYYSIIGVHATSKCCSEFSKATSKWSVMWLWALLTTGDLSDVWKIVHQWEERILATRLDKCLQPAVVPRIELINMRLPDYGADVRRNAQENTCIVYRVIYNRCIQGWLDQDSYYDLIHGVYIYIYI